MNSIKEKVDELAGEFRRIKENPGFEKERRLPGNSYFIYDDNILVLPRDDGDCRYPYGKGGFNFWVYASGYMHCNEGLFSPFLRAAEGQEPKIAFFAGFQKEDGEYSRVPLLPVPVMNPAEAKHCGQYTVFLKNCVYYITEAEGLRFAVRVFVDGRDIFFTIYAENLEKEAKRFFISSYLNPFLSHDIFENAESRWFREARYLDAAAEGSDLGSFIIKVNEDLNRTTSVSNIGVVHRDIITDRDSRIVRHEETASRYDFVGGTRNSLNSPASLRLGSFGNARKVCALTDIGIAGDIIHLEIAGAGSARYDLTFSYVAGCTDENGAKELFGEKLDRDLLETGILASYASESEASDRLVCTVGNSKNSSLRAETFNSFLVHLKKQVEFCSLIKGYVQLAANSLIGIRDVFQAIEGSMFWQPSAAREKMLEALGFISPDGRCPRQYTLPAGGSAPRMDLRAFIDQGVWVISTVVSYLKLTGDYSFLNEECGYYEIIDESKGIVKKSEIKNSVLEHILKIADYLLSKRDFEETKCIRILYGDWNDALDGLGVSCDPEREFGSGVSVMASLQVYQNLMEMSDLLRRLGPNTFNARIREYERAASELRDGLQKYAVVTDEAGEKRIIHGWGDKRAYMVGGFEDPDHVSRYGLISNAFWVLSQMYDSDTGIKETIMGAFEKLDSRYGFKTFTPAFKPDTKGIGRIRKLFPGTYENGAVYVHATAFAIMALFRMGHPREAWEQLIKLLPYTHDRVSCSPYVMPNCYGENADLLIDGDSVLDWQTGSSNVVLKTLVRFVFGVEPDYDGIWIQPAKGLPFTGFVFRIVIRSCRLVLKYENKGCGARRYFKDGMERKGVYDGIMDIDKLWLPQNELEQQEIEILIEDQAL